MWKVINQERLRVNRKSKGQALIEFVIILPLFVFMILAVIDLGKILYFSNILESKMDDVVTYYEDKKSFNEINDLVKLDDKTIEFEATNENNNYVVFKLTKDLEIITPGLNFILGNPYNILAKRTIEYEQ